MQKEGFQRGIQNGVKQGRNERDMEYILKMYNKNYPVEEIADLAGKTISEIYEVLKEKEVLLS